LYEFPATPRHMLCLGLFTSRNVQLPPADLLAPENQIG